MKDKFGYIIATTDEEATEAADQVRFKIMDKTKYLMPLMGKILVHKLFIKEKEKTAGGLELPGHLQKQNSINLYETSPFQAVVVKIGREFDMGPMNQEKMYLKEGDHIICKGELSDDLKRGAFMYERIMFSYINQTDVICIVSSKGTQKVAPASGTTEEKRENGNSKEEVK